MNFTKEKISTIDQQDIFKITLTNNHNYSISFFNFGGYIHSILIPYLNQPDKQEDVLLGYDKFENYITDKSYFNCIVGRVCGRIANSKFYLNNKKYKLFSNDGRHHFHGGQSGFNKKIWNINFLDKNSDEIICLLDYRSPDAEEGYPGNVECTTKYTLNNKNEFDPLEIFKEYRDTKEEPSQWKLGQVFQKTDIIGNLIKKKRNNLYFLDLDF